MSGQAAGLWAHQPVAVTAVEEALRDGGRATVEAACGTGKSRIGAQAAARLAPAGRVLAMVPTLELVAQMLETFGEHGRAGLGRVVAAWMPARRRSPPIRRSWRRGRAWRAG